MFLCKQKTAYEMRISDWRFRRVLFRSADLDGNSVVPLLEDAGAPFPPALMTYKKGNHAVRTERWRYIQYADGTEELYDHAQDHHEWNNLATETQYQAVLDKIGRAHV